MNQLDQGIKLYKKRWMILAIFMSFSTISAFQWAEYSVVEDVIVDYYNVQSSLVEWTTMAYNLNMSLFIIPWVWLLQKYGLRKILLLGSGLNTFGAVLKIFSSSRSSFMIAFVGQWLVAAGQLAYFPSRVAALWFGADEISTACSFGVVGNQLGSALGFLIPPMIVKMNGDKEITRSQIKLLNYLVAAACVIVHVLIFACLRDEPKLPPSRAALEQRKEKVDFVGTLKRLSRNKGYICLAAVYGINMGIFCAIATLLNRMVLGYFPEAGEHVGRIGLILILSGSTGTVIAGFLLDKFGNFKELSIIFPLCSAVTIITTALLIDKGQIALIYICGGTIGFFMTGYVTIGLEYGAELAYPENEGTSLGILNGIPQSAAIGTTLLGSQIIQAKGTIWCLYAFSLAMLTVALVASTIPKDYRRRSMKTKLGVETKVEMKPLRPDENHV